VRKVDVTHSHRQHLAAPGAVSSATMIDALSRGELCPSSAASSASLIRRSTMAVATPV
jgi:hypothetical protein